MRMAIGDAMYWLMRHRNSHQASILTQKIEWNDLDDTRGQIQRLIAICHSSRGSGELGRCIYILCILEMIIYLICFLIRKIKKKIVISLQDDSKLNKRFRHSFHFCMLYKYRCLWTLCSIVYYDISVYSHFIMLPSISRVGFEIFVVLFSSYESQPIWANDLERRTNIEFPERKKLYMQIYYIFHCWMQIEIEWQCYGYFVNVYFDFSIERWSLIC